MAEGVIPVPDLCRVERQRDDGSWGVLHRGFGLADPRRYVGRAAARGSRLRATVLDAELRPTGPTYTGPCPACGGPDHNCRELL
jgi:hypothetical protein